MTPDPPSDGSKPRPSRLPTDHRAVVRVLLRGLDEGEGARIIEGQDVLVTAVASPSRWPVRVLEGDVEGVVWTTYSQVPRVIASLQRSKHVVWALGEKASP